MKQLELLSSNVQCPKCRASGREPCRDEHKKRPRKLVHRERLIAEAKAALEQT